MPVRTRARPEMAEEMTELYARHALLLPRSRSSSEDRSPQGRSVHGRSAELTALQAVLAGAAQGHGSALVLRGHAGIGKTTLLEAARAWALEAGTEVLATNGAEAEAALPFAGLHQLLVPLLDGVAALPARLQRTLRGAFGLEDVQPDLFSVGLAVLELLGDRAHHAPLLLLVEDAHWLDPETLDVLLFVARRIATEPIAMLVAVRAQYPEVLAGSGLGQLMLGELDPVASERVLADHDPGLSAQARGCVLAEAGGNPLALVELPRLLADGAARAIPELLPLNERLESAFADRFAALPDVTRDLLAVLSADAGAPVPALLAAAGTVYARAARVTDLQPAIDAGLLVVRSHELHFRHPLVRSAVYGSVTEMTRLSIHAALAEGLVDDLDRRAWHASASTFGTDEQVCDELEAAAERARARGAASVVVGNLTRASELTASAQRRTSLLLRAAELACQTNDRRVAADLVARADTGGLDVLDRSRLVLVRDTVDAGDLRDTDRIAFLTDLAEAARDAGSGTLPALLCWRAASRCWWGSVPTEVGARVTGVLETLRLPPDDPRTLAIQAYAQSDALGGSVLQRLATLVPDRSDTDSMRFLGGAALVLGDFIPAASYLGTAAAGYRTQGRAALLASTLVPSGYIRLWLGNWPAVQAELEEAAALAEETVDHLWVLSSRATQAMLHAMRGDGGTATTLAEDVLAEPLLAGVRFTAAGAQHARGIAANAAGRHGEALDVLLRLYEPDHPTHQLDMSGWALPDLADAAVRTGRQAEVAHILDAAAERGLRFPSPMLHRSLAYAQAVLATEGDAGAAFERALALDHTGWPVHHARLQLAYGSWLRRQRRILASRASLRAAREGFDALGARYWGGLAREELRAAGEESQGVRRAPREQLTPQELQIATLAAHGLSNREIGQRLFLSHRTVSSHLYRIFPKLGVSSRGQLGGALEAADS